MRTPCFLIAVVVACTPAAAGSGSGSGDISSRFEHDMIVRLHMHENFGMVAAIERLLVRNQLDPARELARGIATAPDEPGMSVWATQTAKVREEASAVANAKTVDDAIHAVTRLGAECAACHVASSTFPDLAAPPVVPPDQTTVEARMTRHRWATDRLWEGVIGLSDDSWQGGLDVLASSPLPATELGADREALAKTLQRTALRARKTKAADRAQVYGDMLVVCAACHARR